MSTLFLSYQTFSIPVE